MHLTQPITLPAALSLPPPAQMLQDKIRQQYRVRLILDNLPITTYDLELDPESGGCLVGWVARWVAGWCGGWVAGRVDGAVAWAGSSGGVGAGTRARSSLRTQRHCLPACRPCCACRVPPPPAARLQCAPGTRWGTSWMTSIM